MIPVIPSAAGDPSPAGDVASTEQRHATQPDTSKHVYRAVGLKRGAEDNPMSSSAKRAHTPLLRCPRSCRSQMLKWGQSRCEMAQRHKESQFDAGGLCRQHQRGSMSRYCLVSAADVTLMKFWRQLPESDQNPHRCKSAKCASGVADTERSSMQTVISTRMPHEAKRNKAQPRIVIPECADAMRVSEHYTSTPYTRTQRLTINRMVSECRTRQPESCETLSAFFHDWLERGVQTELPTDLRLNGGRCWQPVKALPLPSLGVSVRWSSGRSYSTLANSTLATLNLVDFGQFDLGQLDFGQN